MTYEEQQRRLFSAKYEEARRLATHGYSEDASDVIIGATLICLFLDLVCDSLSGMDETLHHINRNY